MALDDDLLEAADRFHRAGALESAAQLYEQILRAWPDRADVWCRLGEIYHAHGAYAGAAECYQRAQALRPDDPVPPNNRGLALLHQGRAHDAALLFRQAASLRPDLAQVQNNLGLALLHQGRVDEALDSFRQAVALQPDLAQAQNNLGLALLHQGRDDEALDCFRKAVNLEPGLAEAQNNLGLAFAARGRPDEALACYARAVQLDPGHGGALANLGNAYKDQGSLAEAIACYWGALAVRPDDPRIHSNLLLALHYQPGADPAGILAESRRYAARHAAPLAGSWPPHRVRPLEGRRLRVGYVSADFREHSVTLFLEPILAAHDHRRFEVFAYADVPRADAVTERCRGYVDHWRSLVGLSDEQAAERIRRDGIDLAIDLAGHSGGNRLLAFARKPAPVQASYLGYLGTTGLEAMDYYITDADTDPPGLTDAHFQERLVRLPGCAFCYGPGDAPEPRAELPARNAGRFTFASLNPPVKVSEEVLALWLRIVEAVPGSRLLLRTGEGHLADERVRAAVARQGLAPERVELRGRTSRRFD